MCGIAGVYGISDRSRFPEACGAVGRMVEAISHRGPDAHGVWMDDDEVVLGHRRLSIIDRREASNQPFIDSATGDVMVFNGEIYNYRELRPQLSGEYAFQTDSDTEVALAAMQVWGRAALPEFNGMFSFAYWNQARRELTLVRDRMGIKPLYYAHIDNMVLFSSEVRSLLASDWLERKHDPAGLADYLRYQTVHSPRTILAGVSMLPAGHWMRLEGEETEIGRWWDPAAAAKPQNRSREDELKRIREVLSRSVELRLRSDVPLGAFLSGGIDSSVIVGLMKQATEHRTATFSVIFNEGKFDESYYSRMIAERFDTDHHEIRLTPDNFIQAVPDALDAMDHPSGDGPNSYVISEATKSAGITVALSGLGGDELFAGYPVFQRTKLLWDQRWLGSWPKGLRKLIGGVYAAYKNDIAAYKKAAALAGDYFDLLHTYPLSRQAFLEPDIRRLAPHLAVYPNAVYNQLLEELGAKSHGEKLPMLGQVSVAELGTYMQNTLLRDADQMSMAHALEVRVPFLDHDVVAAVLSVSDENKWPHTPKQLLTDAFPDLLPREVIDRPKMGFTLPWELWMRNSLKPMCEEGLEALSEINVFAAAEISSIWDAFVQGSRRWPFSRVWSLVVLGHWFKKNRIT